MRKLKQITTGRIYVYTEALAKRKDMVLIEEEPKKPKRGKKKAKVKVGVKESSKSEDLIKIEDSSDEQE